MKKKMHENVRKIKKVLTYFKRYGRVSFDELPKTVGAGWHKLKNAYRGIYR